MNDIAEMSKERQKLSNEDVIWIQLHKFMSENISSLELSGRHGISYKNDNHKIRIELSNYPHVVGLGYMIESGLEHILEKSTIGEIKIYNRTGQIIHEFHGYKIDSEFSIQVFELLSEHLNKVVSEKNDAISKNNEKIANWMKKVL